MVSPQPNSAPTVIRRFTGEHALDKIDRGRRFVPGLGTTCARQSLDRCAGHQHLDLAVSHP
jgi:hypothetical protein